MIWCAMSLLYIYIYNADVMVNFYYYIMKLYNNLLNSITNIFISQLFNSTDIIIPTDHWFSLCPKVISWTRISCNEASYMRLSYCNAIVQDLNSESASSHRICEHKRAHPSHEATLL